MVPLLIYTYHRRPQWRIPIAFLIVILLLSPFILIFWSPFDSFSRPEDQGSLPKGNDGFPSPLSKFINWTIVVVPWPSDWIQLHSPFFLLPQNHSFGLSFGNSFNNSWQNSRPFGSFSRRGNASANNLEKKQIVSKQEYASLTFETEKGDQFFSPPLQAPTPSMQPP